MSSQIVYVVKTTVVGGLLTANVVSNAMQPATSGPPGTPRDDQFLQFWGLRASSDATANPSGGDVVRTITLKMDASAIATGTVTVGAGSTEGPIIGVTITGQGLDYIQPPLLTLTDTTGSGAVLTAGLQVLNTAQTTIGGTGYTATATAVAKNGLLPGGTPATFALTIVGGTITAVTCTNTATNGPYAYQPTIVISDPANPGGTAAWTTRMGIHPTVSIVVPGNNYTAPTLNFVPYFKTLCPDTMTAVQQGQCVLGWMSGILSQALLMPFYELVPVVT
jgi:hypothetical protein